MQKNIFQRWNNVEVPLALLVFFILVVFTYGILVQAAYSGFYFNPLDGHILEIYVESDSESSLQLGDVLKQIGPVSWDEFHENRRLVLFENVREGEIVNITVERAGQQLTIPWVYPGFNSVQFIGRFVNIWPLAYIFWFIGFAVQLFIRPKDQRWQLFIATNYLTALWLIFGFLSTWHLWESSILLHALSWLILPVYLHLHWVFPRPLGKMPKAVWGFIYLIGIAFAIAELAQFLPRSLYALAFLWALVGSITLEIIHFVKQADQRRDVILLTISILIALAPSIVFGFIVISGSLPTQGPIALLTLPLMPLAYFFIIYRRQLGGLEVRVNRFVSIYAFLILLITLLLVLLIPITRLKLSNEDSVFLAIGIIILTVIITIIGFPAFQAFVEQRFLGIKLPYQNLQEAYSARITTSTSTAHLLQLLERDVFSSLLVRQYAFMQLSNGNLKTLLTRNVTADRLPNGKDIEGLTSQAGKFIPSFSSDDEWIRLILPLKAGDSFVGFWLLGRRDPDDTYSLAEIPILQAMANQTAVALSNIHYAEQLKTMYQSDIERYEKERMRLALELHDSILNELAVLRTNLDESNVSPKFQASYEELTRRLREIVSDLRPPMLMYGLKPAIEELADNLMERNSDKIKIHVDIQAGEERVPENIEKHLYRIVQEGCENSLRHAHAQRIGIFGTLTPQKIDLIIEDDGKGFDMQPEMNSLLVNSHFGLAGMVERARLIDAEISIKSQPNTGVTIYITWAGNDEKS